MADEHPGRVVQLADDVVVAHTSQAYLGLDRSRRVSYEYQFGIWWEHVPSPLSEAALEPDVHCSPEMAGRETAGSRPSSSTAPVVCLTTVSSMSTNAGASASSNGRSCRLRAASNSK